MLWLAWMLSLSLAEDPSFLEGQRLYRAFEYEQAIFRFQEIAVRPQVASDDRAEALVWLGLSYAGTGDLEAARRNFKDALTLHPSAGLPANASPRVKELFDEARASLAPANPSEPKRDPVPSSTPPQGPPTPEQPTAEAPHDASPMLVPGAVLAGVGAVALAGGVVLALLASSSYAEATDPSAFQDDAQAALDRTNTEVIAAGVMLPVGALLAGSGVAMIVVSMMAE
jgi:tetratricopeptide (TPR) repeat protein